MHIEAPIARDCVSGFNSCHLLQATQYLMGAQEQQSPLVLGESHGPRHRFQVQSVYRTETRGEYGGEFCLQRIMDLSGRAHERERLVRQGQNLHGGIQNAYVIPPIVPLQPGCLSQNSLPQQSADR